MGPAKHKVSLQQNIQYLHKSAWTRELMLVEPMEDHTFNIWNRWEKKVRLE